MVALVAVCAAFLGGARATADDVPFAARDAHQNFVVAADPYTQEARSKEKFGKKHPHKAGILATEVFFKNDNPRAVEIATEEIRLLIHAPGQSRQRIAPLPPDEVMERILFPEGFSPSVPRVPLPGRTGSKQGRNSKDWKKLEEIMRPLVLEMDIIPPGATVRGFIFFNMGGLFDQVQYAQLYVPDLVMLPDRQPLLFFEVDLSKAGAD